MYFWNDNYVSEENWSVSVIVGMKGKTMTVGKLKEYLNDIDDNVEIKKLLLRCENGYAIQSKMRWIDNEDIIEELEKTRKEIQSIIALADSREEDTKLAYQCQIVINERISELKEQ